MEVQLIKSLEVAKTQSPWGAYVTESLLGTGGWSKVYRVTKTETGEKFAGKLSDAKAQLWEEAKILRSLSHNHIVKFVDFVTTSGPAGPLLVTELCIGGTLQAKIDQHPEAIGRKQALLVILQVGEALSYLHGKNLFHTDMKPLNILVRTWEPVDVVLADCADIRSPRQFRKLTGTEAFFSPQIVKGRRNYGPSDDIWALGMTLLSLMKQLPPVFYIKNDLKKYPKQCFDHVQQLKRLNPDDDLVALLSRMLEWEPRTRTTASGCVRFAEACLERTSQTATDGSDFVFKTAEDFKPLSFW